MEHSIFSGSVRLRTFTAWWREFHIGCYIAINQSTNQHIDRCLHAVVAFCYLMQINETERQTTSFFSTRPWRENGFALFSQIFCWSCWCCCCLACALSAYIVAPLYAQIACRPSTSYSVQSSQHHRALVLFSTPIIAVFVGVTQFAFGIFQE